ncbi:MAG: magnesium/cobalt transporter CorA [Candidatus Tritonobacter lacicola]|nr:magnesium/cobalt transporter CorA [Candidatus Tritonobacter lacicola]
MITSFARLEDGTFKRGIDRPEIKGVLAGETNLLWLDLEDPTEEEIDIIREEFDFHPLLIEDCIASHSHPKIDEFKDYLFMVIHSCYHYKDKREEDALDIRELNIFIGPNYIITYHNGHIRAVSSNRKRCEKSSHIMRGDSDFLLYNILDQLIDNYFPILEEYGERLNSIENQILARPRPELLERMFSMKRNIMTMRRVIGPQRELISRFGRGDYSIVRHNNRPYFNDIHDHIIRIYEMIETSRELIVTDMEAYLSSVSYKLNEIMKTLTIIATIFIPLTFITGLYGMNFRLMPELSWKYGYLFAWGLIALVTFLMLAYFRKRRLI